jgi:hypothetical protein
MGYVQHTADGRKVSHDEMSHQHLSNCVWHFRIWKNAPDASLQHFFETLERRFNGELLPFRPVMTFTAEIDALYRSGMVEKVDEYKSNIRWKGNIIGDMFNSLDAMNAWNEKEAYEKELKGE